MDATVRDHVVGARGRALLVAVIAALSVLLAGCSDDPPPAPAETTDAATDDTAATDDDATDDTATSDDATTEEPDTAPDDGPADDDPTDDDPTDVGDDGSAEDPATDGREVTVQVFFTTDERGGDPGVRPFDRTVTGPAVLAGALRELLAGPTPEEEAEGVVSWFSPETAELLRSVRIEDGTAVVDLDARLRELLPGASSSAGSQMLLQELDATATQFDTVDEAVYALDGDVEAFYSWLQYATPPGW